MLKQHSTVKGCDPAILTGQAATMLHSTTTAKPKPSHFPTTILYFNIVSVPRRVTTYVPLGSSAFNGMANSPSACFLF